ncbi:MAG: PqqD family protein [Chloroflexota bacterium]|nr:PqqD family protein [Chloroflexota bacterium]
MPEATTPWRRAVINGSVAGAELGDELVLLNVETGVYFGLDAVGADIWKLLAKGATESEIVDRLLAEYDVEPGRLRAELAAFLAALEDKGLARIVRG